MTLKAPLDQSSEVVDGNRRWNPEWYTWLSALIKDIITELGNLKSYIDSVIAALPSPFTTGDAKLTFKTVADSGWVLMNDGTIGDASSGSSARANADTAALFALFYSQFTDAICPILTSGGTATTRAAQGTSSAAFAAHCRMTLPRQLGRGLAVAGSGSGLTARALGGFDGAETHSITVAEMPAHAHGVNDATHTHSASDAGHTHGMGYLSAYGGGTLNAIFSGGSDTPTSTAFASISVGAAFSNISIQSNGSGVAMNLMNPRSYWNVMVKL